MRMTSGNVPHPIPYQGSKRWAADIILGHFPDNVNRLIEPFAGSAAISLAAAKNRRAEQFWLNDLNSPLMQLWNEIINRPDMLADSYEHIWLEQQNHEKEYYNLIRDEFNRYNRPDYFLYLLARCVKASVRYNPQGEFNQSPDNRRKGATPDDMRRRIKGASLLMRGRTLLTALDYKQVLKEVSSNDLIYMDPPYQGICNNKDKRYLKTISLGDFINALEELNRRNCLYILSYDGKMGNREYGEHLPTSLELTHIEIDAGRSTQATLLGRNDRTIESLYLSPALMRYSNEKPVSIPSHSKQLQLV